MASAHSKTFDPNHLMETWMENTKHFWHDFYTSNETPAPQAQEVNAAQPSDEEHKKENTPNEKYSSYQTWKTSADNFLTFLQYMSAPENREVMMKSGAAFADTLMNAASDSLENFTDAQNQLLNTLAKFSEHSIYNIDEIDHSAFESFRNLYKSEIQKYLQIPKIGLPRQYQEQVTRFFDRSSLFSSHLVELLYLFSVPFEKTNATMQEKIKKQMEQGKISEDFNTTYKEWISILEESCIELMKSPEYTNVLNDTIQSLVMYKEAKDDVAAVLMKELQVPTNKEMDEVYKDLYQMKKTLKSLQKEIKELKGALQEKNLEMQNSLKHEETYIG